MSAATQTWAVASLATRLWAREVARVSGVRGSVVLVGVASSLLLCIGLGAILAYIAGAQLTSEIPPDIRAAMLRTSFAGASLTAGGVGIVLCLSMPPRTALQNLLDLLPIGRAQAQIGQLLPLVMTGLVYSLALSSTATVIIVKSSSGVPDVLAGLSLYVLLVTVVLVVSVALFMILQTAATKWLRLSNQYSSTVAGVLGLGLILLSTVPDILAFNPVLPTSFQLSELLPSRSFAWAATGEPWAVMTVGCYCSIGAALAWLSARFRAPQLKPAQVKILMGLRPLRSRPWHGLIWSEILIALRNPQIAVTAIMVPMAAGAVLLLSYSSTVGAPLAGPLGSSIVVFPFMLAVYSVGRTYPSRWVLRGANVGNAAPALAKIIAVLVTSGPLSIVAFVFLAMSGKFDLTGSADLAARCLLAVALALLAGTIIPFSEQQPLSIVAGGFVLALTYLVISLAVSLLSQNLVDGTAALLNLAVSVVAAGLYLLAFDRVSSSNVVRV